MLRNSLIGLASLIVLRVPLCGQVRVLFTPESLVSSAPLLRSNKIGLWVVRACNDSHVDVTIPPERFYIANPDFPGMSIERASLLIGERYRTNPKLVAARLIEYGVLIATVVVSGGTITAGAKVLASLGLSLTVAHLTGDKLKGEVPPLNSVLGAMLDAPVHLGPQGSGQDCATRTVFSSLQPKAKVVSFSTTLPLLSRSLGDLLAGPIYASTPQHVAGPFISEGLAEFDRSVAQRRPAIPRDAEWANMGQATAYSFK